MRLAFLCFVIALVEVGCHGAPSATIGDLGTTVGDLQVLHADVNLGGGRLRDGDAIKTGPAGRARVRLDDGTVLVVGDSTTLTLEGTRVTLQQGRLFVQATGASRTEVAVKDVVTNVVNAAAGFDARADAKVYCARGELVVTQGGKTWHAASGETATLGGTPKVAPEAAFDDWTGGLAVPWSGERGAASAIAEVWGTNRPADPGSPLVIRGEKVNVTIDGEIAITRTRTTYFNGSDSPVQADIRVALPEGAIVSHVGRADEGSSSESVAQLGAGNRGTSSALGARLEWAGGGWLNGRLSTIQAGATLDILIDWIEWLPEKNGRATYRFPMASETEAPMVGTLDIRVEGKSAAKWLSASTGAKVVNGGIELHRADVRPTGDLVVEMVPGVVKKNAARAYVQPGGEGEDPFVVVRTEAPDLDDRGVSLALVVDSSSSVGAALLETERAAVDAVLDALGPKDSVLVLAADQDAVVVGPSKPSPVTPELRATIRSALANVRASGASNLGIGLERAADLLDAQSPNGMVVYIGDGRPTVGETDAASLRKRLARRASGVPRLGALAVGQGADHWMLAELVAGGGPVYDVLDRPDAARASSALVAEALAPSLRDVSLALGATVDRVYPRDARTISAGSTITMAGRLRGALPSSIALRYRKGTELVEEQQALVSITPPAFADIERRWANERIQESITHADGVEPGIALAKKVGLLTPWTSFFWEGSDASSSWDRLLGVSSSDTAYAARVQPAPPPPSLLLEPPPTFEGEATIEQAAEIAARHAIESATAAMVACRDARASVKPGIGNDLKIDVSVNADGKTTKVSIASNDAQNDPVLNRCIKVVVDAVPFYGPGVAIAFSQNISLPPGQSSRRTQCSVASTLPLAVRRGIWRARMQAGTIDYETALHDCELPKWSDRRALLAIFVKGIDATTGTRLASHLTAIGETDAAAFVRQELIRQATAGTLSYEELRRLLINDEPKIDRALDKAFRAARTDDARRAVLNRYLRLAPHSPLGRRMLLSLLESTKDRAGLLTTVDQIHDDPFADAGLLAECASALRRQGMDQEGRRAFGDLVERAPRDPWTLGYVGDRLRAEGLYEDALSAYERLNVAMPDDPAVSLRLALAHAGAGRLDVAARLLDRVAQTGGRGDDGRLGELAAVVSASLIAKARQASPAAETDALLARRLAQTPLPDVASVLLVRTPLGDDKVEVLVARQVKDKDELPADLDASSMGLSAVRIERGGGTARLHLRRTARLAGSRPVHAVVTALLLGGDRSQAKLVTREVDVPSDEKGIELRWNGEVFE